MHVSYIIIALHGGINQIKFGKRLVLRSFVK